MLNLEPFILHGFAVNTTKDLEIENYRLLKLFIKGELKFKFMKYLLVCFYFELLLLQTCMNSESVCNLCRKRLVGHSLLILGILSNMLALGIIYNVYKLSDP